MKVVHGKFEDREILDSFLEDAKKDIEEYGDEVRCGVLLLITKDGETLHRYAASPMEMCFMEKIISKVSELMTFPDD